MMYRPVNVATITAALVAQIAHHPGVADLKTTVERAGELNATPGQCPWVGVYRDEVTYVIKTLGFGNAARDQRVSLVIAVQDADPSSGEACEDRLEKLVQEVMAALLSDLTIGGTARTIEDLVVRYTDYRKVPGGSFMQTAAVYLTAVTSVQVTQ